MSQEVEKYIEAIRSRFLQTPIDWNPQIYINNSLTEFFPQDGLEILISEKSLFKKKGLLRVIIKEVKVEKIEDCVPIIESLKSKFDIYTIVVFVSKPSKDLLRFVETYNHDKNSLILVDLEGNLWYDTKAATLPYTKWFDLNTQPKSTKDVLKALAKDNKIKATDIREHFNFAYLQALTFLDSCKFLKREGYSDVFYLK